MPEDVLNAPMVCERCDAESRHLVKSIGPDNRTRYVCWTCINREEKRVNLKQTWKRGGRLSPKGREAS